MLASSNTVRQPVEKFLNTTLQAPPPPLVRLDSVQQQASDAQAKKHSLIITVVPCVVIGVMIIGEDTFTAA